MAVITVTSENNDREFDLTYSSDSPSVRMPYTRKPHIAEDDIVFSRTTSIEEEPETTTEEPGE